MSTTSETLRKLASQVREAAEKKPAQAPVQEIDLQKLASFLAFYGERK